jgi:hypothetical protein
MSNRPDVLAAAHKDSRTADPLAATERPRRARLVKAMLEMGRAMKVQTPTAGRLMATGFRRRNYPIEPVAPAIRNGFMSLELLPSVVGLPQTADPEEIWRASQNRFSALVESAAQGDDQARKAVIRLRLAYLNWAYGGEREAVVRPTRTTPGA